MYPKPTSGPERKKTRRPSVVIATATYAIGLTNTGRDSFDAELAKLIAALDTDVDWKQDHTRLLTRAKEWEREGKDTSFLLRGRDLREAERWVAKSAEKQPKPTTLHSQYILASRQSATKAQRIIIGTVAVGFLIAVGLAPQLRLPRRKEVESGKAVEPDRMATERLAGVRARL